MPNSTYSTDQLPELIFEKNRFKVKICPCGKSNKDGKFIPYIGHENKGYCHSCGITFLPEIACKQYIQPCLRTTPKNNPISYIPDEVFKASLKSNKNNHFVTFLTNQFGMDITTSLIEKYFIGTSKHWNGATVFWQQDIEGKIRTGKIMLYDRETGKRVKSQFNHITWVHSALAIPEFSLKQCLFGEHLLKNSTKPVALVESEKTAIIASVYFPEFIWLAVGSITNLNLDKCRALQGRNIMLFPDLNGFDKWSLKANEMAELGTFKVFDLLEQHATEQERTQGLDLADYLIRFNYQDFVPAPYLSPVADSPVTQEPLTEQALPDTELLQVSNESKPDSYDIKALEEYFKQVPLPTESIKLNGFCTIKNVALFIDSHITALKANINKKSFLTYFDRLQELQRILTQV